MTTNYPKQLQLLINYLKKLPGIGSKTAQRLAFSMLKWEDHSLSHFGSTISDLKAHIHLCSECGCLMNQEICDFCENSRRDQKKICILSSPKEVYLIEETGTYQGLYHIIDHLLSPIEGFSEEDLHLEKFKKRLTKYPIEEIIIALDSTLEGDATALFLKNTLQNNTQIKISRLALGLPVGSALEYIDGGTLARALMGRQNF
jgi:recombination protein RecR